MGTKNAYGPLNTLKPQPGQSGSYTKTFHPLPGEWAKEQMSGQSVDRSQTTAGSRESSELQKALASERAQHEYWEQWQGVTPGKAVYADPREMQNTLLPAAKYGTEGRGYG